MPSDRPRRTTLPSAAAVLAALALLCVLAVLGLAALVLTGYGTGEAPPPAPERSRGPSAPEPPALTAGRSVTLRTVDGGRAVLVEPGGGVRIRVPGTGPADRRGATLLVRAGRADPRCVTLESRRWPGRVLRQDGAGVALGVPDGSPAFDAAATFCPSAGAGEVALRSPAGGYLRATGGGLDVAPAGSAFAVTAPLWRSGADVPVGRVALEPEPVAAPARFLRTGPGEVGLGTVTTSSPAAAQLAAAVTVVPGLADPSCSSFRPVTDPAAYLRVSGSSLRAERPAGPPAADFAADATFCAQPASTGTGVAWQSYARPERWLGATGDQVRLVPDEAAPGTAWSVRDGTWNAPEWITTWGSALTRASGPVGPDGLTDATLRQVAHLSRGGDALRVRLSNRYGDRPLVVDRSTVAVSIGGSSIDPTTLTRLTFGGRPDVTIAPGREVVSDPADLAVRTGAGLAVSVYLPGPTGPLTMHREGIATSYAAQGDATGADGKLPPLDRSRYLLSGVEVRTAGSRTVSFFGDSLTDGSSSTPDADRRYPDQVVRTLPTARVFGVANAGLGGNRLLQRGSDPFGEAGVARFATDVLARPGVRDVVVLIGINDLKGTHQPSAAEVLAGYRRLVDEAHARGVRVTGATLAPTFGHGSWNAAGERTRQELNYAIRAGDVFDAVVDVDGVVRDPADPRRLRPGLDSGDHLHPNDAGYAAMGAAARAVLEEAWRG